MALQTMMKRMSLLVCSGTHCSITDSINSKEKFAEIVERERERSNRNGHGFSVISYNISNSDVNKPAVKRLLTVLPQRMRLTDEIGWLDDQHIGLLLYSSKMEDARSFARNIERDIVAEEQESPNYFIRTYPQSSDWSGGNGDKKLEGEKKQAEKTQHANLDETEDLILTVNQKLPRWKRFVDLAGASFGLIICAPLFLCIGIFIKIVSPGPVFFKQVRVGYGGKPFMFWKFRTMKVNVDTTAHQKLLADLINSGETDKPMAKLDHDPQIIPFGKILRKSCIDELPQLINVFRGEMSLIGPRPPIPYEVDEYDRWHNERLSTVPGMTGLWQVSGKNRLTFKEMVRLDIRYLRNRSLVSDLKILIMTPVAILGQIRDIL